MRLQLQGIAKTFGGTRALQNIHMEVAAGEIHALLGENGAGKTTLTKIISGVYRPDAGSVWLDGQEFAPGSPIQARQAGVSIIFQEPVLAPHLSVEENIVLGSEPAVNGWIRAKVRRKLARAALAELHGTDIPLDAPAGSLPPAQQQLIEIARALLTRSKVLLLDEPTSSLTREDARSLFTVIRKLAARGVAIIYISHFLEESLELCHRYTVLRDGAVVAAGTMAEMDFSRTLKLMVGRDLAEIYPRFSHYQGDPVLELKALSGNSKLLNVDLTLHEGEIFGLAGLVGAGRTEMLRTLFGLEKIRGGKVFLDGRPATIATPGKRLRAGVGLASEDREGEGLMGNLSVADNLTLAHMGDFGRLGFISPDRQYMAALDWMQKLHVRARGPFQMICQLSGGNQQKVVLGRMLQQKLRVFLLDEPTRGIDVGTKAQFYKLIGEMASEGKAILFVSSYLPELLGVCDTIGVMCRRRLVAVRPAGEWTETEIINASTGLDMVNPSTP